MLTRTFLSMAIIGGAMLGSGCAAHKYRYHIDETSAPVGAIDSVGGYTDNMISIGVDEELGMFGTPLVGFKLNITNKSNETVKIDWNGATLVDPDGKLSPLVTGEVRFIDVEKAIKPTIVPRGITLTESVFPSKNSYFDPLTKSYQFKAMGYVTTDSLVGKKVTINLPIESQTTGRREYSFVVRFKEI